MGNIYSIHYCEYPTNHSPSIGEWMKLVFESFQRYKAVLFLNSAYIFLCMRLPWNPVDTRFPVERVAPKCLLYSDRSSLKHAGRAENHKKSHKKRTINAISRKQFHFLCFCACGELNSSCSYKKKKNLDNTKSVSNLRVEHINT